jgi:hypothetical protein
VGKIMAAFPLFGFYIQIFLHVTYIALNKKKYMFRQYSSSCLSATNLNEINASFAMQCVFQRNLQNNMFLNLYFIAVFVGTF